ncbi:protein MpNPF23 [Marchantia polymorpha subsp. ruderalis]|uniref:Major facilitator superfamily (MFS) profile domain-containing protein n=2 Tax=Marchantia polymorpha TaxID=3197 RepID=A0A176W5V9_MARPO|nr:hypothetical protein AXG93_115s1270 [Marchantia polymorpha subsp. ruderalis]PTQ43031.1 hypothetical protein MARPO_0027s0133 [Marchantia polymorpha]BBN10604.1 hypothetical protein Mp_5g04940 [Marchantia polymorpha subsp. ruderalis]|eukprot:PTQ43031.1 hypothetical protein MARPO_0027s0133 [Marchantia polymorpha]
MNRMGTMDRVGSSDLDRILLVEKSWQPVVAGSHVKYLLFLEFADTLAFRGLQSVLEILLVENLQLSGNLATELFHFFIVSSFVGCIVGSMISDRYLGKYQSICVFSLVSVVASIGLVITSLTSQLEGTLNQALAFVSLLVFTLGYGGNRPSLATLGGDEVKHLALIELGDHTDPRGAATPQQLWFSSMYITGNLAHIFGAILFPLIRLLSHGSTFYIMLVLACAKTSGLFVFWLGRNRYLSVAHASNKPGPPDGDHEQRHQKYVQTDSAQDTTELLDGDSKTVKWDGYTVLSSTFIFLLPTSIFHGLNFQSSSTWVYQALSMDRDVRWLNHWTIAADQMQVLKPTFVTLIAPLLNQIIYPYVDRHIAKVTNLRKCVGSMLLATLAFAMSGGIQLVIDMQTGHGAAGGSDVSIFWQLPQILAISFAEPMCLIPLYDWTYNQSPDDMKATYSGIFLAMAGLGNLVTVVCVALLGAHAADAMGAFFFTGLGALATLTLAILAVKFVA